MRRVRFEHVTDIGRQGNPLGELTGENRPSLMVRGTGIEPTGTRQPHGSD